MQGEAQRAGTVQPPEGRLGESYQCVSPDHVGKRRARGQSQTPLGDIP